MTIIPFLEEKAFGPEDIQAMSTALEDVCKILNLADEAKSEIELLAKTIIVLARQGERNAALPRDRAPRELATPQSDRRLVRTHSLSPVSRERLQARDQGIGGE
jgi:hypothetical protein